MCVFAFSAVARQDAGVDEIEAFALDSSRPGSGPHIRNPGSLRKLETRYSWVHCAASTRTFTFTFYDYLLLAISSCMFESFVHCALLGSSRSKRVRAATCGTISRPHRRNACSRPSRDCKPLLYASLHVAYENEYEHESFPYIVASMTPYCSTYRRRTSCAGVLRAC